MTTLFENVHSDLRRLLGELDSDGGMITPSIYETAQVLRFYPCIRTIDATVEWLMDQQQADGGWGDPRAPLYRAVPTLAASLALAQRAPGNRRAMQACWAGIDSFNTQAAGWASPLPDDIPVAAELILPRLLQEAQRQSFTLLKSPFVELEELGARRLRLIEKMAPAAATPPTHAWESWGDMAGAHWLDGSGGVGHSPAATAWWLHKTRQQPQLRTHRIRARRYLVKASRATGAGLIGVEPSPWPIPRFELIFVLHTLLLAGLLTDSSLAETAKPHIRRLSQMLIAKGVGFSEFFAPDGDDTAAVVAILAAFGNRSGLAALRPFQGPDYFAAFPFEMHHAPTVTARGAHALALCGEDNRQWLQALSECQHQDGRWTGDKWNRSWLYTSAVVLHAYGPADDPAPASACLQAILTRQHRDGGWGDGASSSVLETAYAVLALHTLRAAGRGGLATEQAWRQARSRLVAWYTSGARIDERLWIDKELYSPERVDRAFLLTALILVLRPETVGAHQVHFDSTPA